MSAGRKLLRNCTDAEIIAYAAQLGYTFTSEDCNDLMSPMFGSFNETLAHAVSDFLNAYER